MNLIEKIREAGIVGCGGAGFPTHVKLNTKAEYLIVNGAECEPLLRTDRWLLRHRAERIVSAAEEAGNLLGASRICIAMKETYTEELEAVRNAVQSLGSWAEASPLKNFYPAGDEQVMVYEVTGRVVPPAGLPGDVGAVVSNAATMNAVADALEGRAFTEKYLTVTGAVEHPIILKTPVGTSLRECIEAAVPTADGYCFIVGGPLMGRIFHEEDAREQVVTKTTSGIIVLPPDSLMASREGMPLEHMLKRARSVCIQCSYCTELCPRHMLGHPLKPNKIMRQISVCSSVDEILGSPDVRQALICSECGVCEEYACPMGLQPRKINKMIKTILGKEGVRYERTGGEWNADEMREYRRVPSKRLAARLGLEAYYDLRIDDLAELAPDSVSIPLKQHIGAPSVPSVKPGDIVTAGQLIAACPEQGLGANIHASISGTVKEVSGSITIGK